MREHEDIFWLFWANSLSHKHYLHLQELYTPIVSLKSQLNHIMSRLAGYVFIKLLRKITNLSEISNAAFSIFVHTIFNEILHFYEKLYHNFAKFLWSMIENTLEICIWNSYLSLKSSLGALWIQPLGL